jgi:adenosine deaminase
MVWNGVMNVNDYLRLLPKTELHCHFVSTMSAAHLIALADREGVALPTTDPDALFDYADLADFLVAFRAATDVLTTAADLEKVARDRSSPALVCPPARLVGRAQGSGMTRFGRRVVEAPWWS